MKKLIILAAGFSVTAAASVFAADMPVKAPVAPAAIPYSWTGFYVGANVGYSWGRAETDFVLPNLAAFGLRTFSQGQHLNGVIGGAQIGYNWQANNQWVFGVEADFQGSAEKDSDPHAASFSAVIGDFRTTLSANETFEAKIKWFGTARGRFGYLVTPTVLLYGTGGLAYGRIETNSAESVTATITTLGGTPIASATVASAIDAT